MKKTPTDIKNEIRNSTLHPYIKETILYRMGEPIDGVVDFDEPTMKEIKNEGLVCDLDACLELYKILTGRDAIVNGQERPDVDTIVLGHFEQNLKDFEYNIVTEDYVTLYVAKKKKTTQTTTQPQTQTITYTDFITKINNSSLNDKGKSFFISKIDDLISNTNINNFFKERTMFYVIEAVKMKFGLVLTQSFFSNTDFKTISSDLLQLHLGL